MTHVPHGPHGPHEAAGPPSVTFASGGLSWTRVRTPRVMSTIAKAFYAISALSAVAAVLTEIDVFRFAGALFTLLTWPLFILSYVLSLTQTSFAGRLEIVGQALTIHTGATQQSIPRAKVKSALVVDRHVFGAFVPTVEIELENGDILVARLPDPNAAHAVVRALGFGHGGGRVHVTMAKPTRRLLHPLLAIAAQVIAFGSVFLAVAALSPQHGTGYEIGVGLYPLLALAIYAAAKSLTRAPELTIGDDGLLIRGRLNTFVPRADIAFASAAAGTSLVIERRNGKRFVLGGTLLDDARRSAVVRVIEERAGPSAAGAERFTHYERAGRTLAAWREHLSRAMNETSYRANAATVDEAAAVLRSVEATPEQRVGAALALRVAGIPKERIRVAVEAAADERMREALEAVAEHDDDVPLEKALKRLSAP